MDDVMSLENRMVVITGGAGGIARATVPLLLADGADVHLIDPHGEGLQSLVAELDAGPRLTTTVSAIDSPEACEAALERLERPIYGLVHLAGIFIPDDLDAASRPVWNDVIAANLTNAFDMAAACRPRLEPDGPSRMIFVSSVAFRRGSFDHIAYTAAKGGIVGLVRALSKKLGPKTLVNGLAPGIIETDMPKHLLAEEKRRKVLIAETALKRFGHPSEVGTVIQFLLGQGASFITGQIINVDGGVANG
jgi:NAD(P)-dependent dehydrogenase (short-subunit alcohol dehydrogenase family)